MEVRELNVNGTAIAMATREHGEFQLWPALGEYPVWDDVTYWVMARDTVRNDAFHAAIRELADGARVADIGTGKDALWAVAAAKAGARHVYAVEELPGPLSQANQTVRDAGLAARVTVIGGSSASVRLPEQVDVCVSEVIGPIGSSQGAAAILADARERFLVPQGVCVPSQCTTMVAAVCLDEAFPDGLAFHRTSLRYVKKIFAAVGYPFDVRICLDGPVDSLIVSSAAPVETLDFNGDLGLGAGTHIDLAVLERTRVHALVLWINLECHAGGDVIDSLRQSTSWMPVIAPISVDGIKVEAGDTISLDWLATTSDDGLHPDYHITGEVIRPGRPSVPVEWESRHHAPTFRSSGAYRTLFPEI
ncbi:SAM-dependent methyltransferase [Micromonospora aurantiaca]|uniref:SAM-dependent methyltransferase n=1 Tax=Micromonospora aurantiaca (nom. illeg.) TaxID=47850 RepID=UPI0033BE4802